MERLTRLGAGGVVGIALALVLLYFAVTYLQVVRAAGRDEAQPAGAIVVLGAAQYNGRPSPVLRARLNHAARLYGRDVAETVVVTGGRQEGDRFTEASAAANYLADRGVPQEAVLREATGRSSWESIAATARILEDEGIGDAVLVSDPYHSYRVGAIAAQVGLDAHTSPTPDTPDSEARSAPRMLREAAAVAVGRVVGFRRLTNYGRLVTDTAREQLPAD